MRRALAVLAVLLLMLVAGIAALVLTFDVNQYKPDIEKAVADATGRSFSIGGPIRIKPSLLPTLELTDVLLGNAPWSQAGPFAEVAHFDLRVSLRPLLERRLEVSRVALSGVRLRLEVNADGVGNWAFAPASPPAPAAAQSATFALPELDVREVRIDQASIDYRPHGGTARGLTIESLHLTTPAPGQPIALELATQIDQQPLAVRGTLAALATWRQDNEADFDLTLTSGAVAATAKGVIAQPLSAPAPRVALDIQAPSLAELGHLAGQKWSAQLAPVRVAGNVAQAQAKTLIEGLNATLGKIDFNGRLSYLAGEARPRVEALLSSKLIDLSPFDPPANARQAPGPRVFSTTPLELAALRAIDADVVLEAGALKTRGVTFSGVKLTAQLNGGKLHIANFASTLEGGSAQGAMTLDASGELPALKTSLALRNVALAHWFDGKNGLAAPAGKTDLMLEVRAAGASPAALAAASNGHVLIDARNLEMAGKGAAAGADLAMSALAMLNPLSQRSDKTIVECAVARFPIAQGRMMNETGIGIRTTQLSIVGGGTIDLGKETLDLGASPKPRAGIGLNLAGIADFIRIGGTLRKPAPVTDAAGAATAGLKVGAAVATGGLSLLAEGLLDRAEADIDACAIARGEQKLPAAKPAASAASGEPAPTTAAQKASNAAGTVVEGAGKVVKGAGDAVKGVFKGLFGD